MKSRPEGIRIPRPPLPGRLELLCEAEAMLRLSAKETRGVHWPLASAEGGPAETGGVSGLEAISTIDAQLGGKKWAEERRQGRD